MSNQRLDVKRWIRKQFANGQYETATELAQAAFAEYPELNEELGFELAQEIFYGR